MDSARDWVRRSYLEVPCAAPYRGLRALGTSRLALYDVAAFAVSYALIAPAALACAASALLRLRCCGEYRMDKLWLIAALLGTLSFPIPMLMPADMKPRIGIYATFS